MLISLFPLGALVGLISSMPIGPINLTLVTTALRMDRQKSMGIAVAVALLDGCYAFASVSMLSLLPVSSSARASIELGGALLVGMYGTYLAILSSRSNLPAEPSRFSRQNYHFGVGFLTGAVLYLSNFSFAVFWLGVAGALHRWLTPAALLVNRLFFAIGVVMGTGLWLCVLVSVVQSSSNRMSRITLQKLSLITGYVLIGFSAYVLIKRISVLV